MTSFVAAEDNVVNVPDQVITASKTNHEKSLKVHTAACEEGPKPKTPTLSDAIKPPSMRGDFEPWMMTR